MKKILLISNHVFHYRIRVYNYFSEKFKEEGYEFNVLSPSAQKDVVDPLFQLDIIKGGFPAYLKYIKKNKPDFIINFLHLKDFRQFPIAYYAKTKNIPILYWNHGINLKTPNAKFKNLFYYHLHNLSSAIVLYSENERNFIKLSNKNKIFIANNTLNLEDFNYPRNYKKDLEQIKKKFGFKSDNIMLFIGRITANKKIHVFFENFKNTNIEIAIVGPGLPSKYQSIVNENPNYFYLGEIYDRQELSMLFNASKLFCIPGNLGLALIEALYWGKPTLTLDGLNTPEIIYLKNNENGYIVKNGKELEEKSVLLANNEDIYNKFSRKSRETFEKEAHIKFMFKGFLDAVKYCEK